jgi:hypothetical protein
MSAALHLGNGRKGSSLADTFESVEFEIALDLQDPLLSGFESCVRAAASVVGGELLFDMPADDTAPNVSRIAAVRIPHDGQDTILLAVLDDSGTRLRVADRREIGDRFYGFARAFVGVIERLKHSRPAPDPDISAGSA